MSLHLDLHLASRLKSFGRALISRFSKPEPAITPPSERATAPMPVMAKRPAHTPSDGVPTVETAPDAITIRTRGALSPDQLAYGADAYHEPDPESTTDDDELDDGRTWNEALATSSIESGPVGRRPLVIDPDGTIH